MSNAEGNLGRDRFEVTAERPLVFVHLVKCAGTSVHDFLVQTFGAEAVSPARQLIDFETIEPGFTVYSGHMFVRQWAGTSLTPYFITWLREPVARVVSSFYYFATMARFAPDMADWFADFRDLSLEEYANGSHPLFRWNAVNHVAHVLGPETVEPMDDEERLFSLAAGALKKFSYIGIAEKTNHCLPRLANRLGIAPPKGQYEANTSAQTAKLISLDLKQQFPVTPEILETIGRNNQVDLALYRKALQRNALMW